MLFARWFFERWNLLNLYGLYFCTIVWIWIMHLAGFLLGSACCSWVLFWRKFTCQNFLKWIVTNESLQFFFFFFYFVGYFFFFFFWYNDGGRNSNLSYPSKGEQTLPLTRNLNPGYEYVVFMEYLCYDVNWLDQLLLC